MAFDIEEYIKERRKKETNSTVTNTSNKEDFDVEEYIKRRKVPEVANTLASRIESWLTKSNDYFTSSSNRYSSRDNSVYGMEDSVGWKETVTSQKDWFNKEAENINKLLSDYENYFDKEWVSNVRNTLNSALRNQEAVVNYADGDIKYWSQWDSEDAYHNDYFGNKYSGKTYADIQEAMGATEGKEKAWLSINADNYMSSAEAQAEIDRLSKVKKPSMFGGISSTSTETAQYKVAQDRISKLTTIKNKAELKEKNSAFLKEAEEDPAYIGYVGRGEKRGSKLTEYRLDPNKAHQDSAQAMRAGGGDYHSDADKFARNMTDDEYQTYLFFLGKHGEDKANEYLGTIEESINAREARMIAGTVSNPLEAIFFGAVAGLDQFNSGIESLFSGEDYIPASSIQMASGIVREDLSDTGPKLPEWLGGGSLGQMGYDAITTSANMLPSIFASVASNAVVPGSGAYVGTALLGASAAGHGKAEMLNLGYSKGQATAYGLMVGAAEGGLQYLLGGITSLGGNSSGLTKWALSKVDNTLARVAITVGSGMISEGFEEGLQTAIEPWLKEIATGVDWESPEIDEILYSSLLGAISSLGFEGIGSVRGEVQYSNALKNTGKDILSVTSGYDALKNLATEVSSEGLVKNEANIGKLVEKTQTGVDAINNKTASGHQQNKTYKQVGKLSESVESVRNEQNLAEIQSSLEGKGLSKTDAKRAAQLLNEALYTDGAYSKELYKSVMKDEGVWDTLRELVSSPNSTLKSRNLKHKFGRLGLKVGEDGTITSSVKAEEAESKYVDESLSFVEDASQRKYTASAEGKSIVKSTDDVIDIVEVASIKDGQMMLKVKDADGVESVVNARDIEYSSGSEALVYEAVANMGLNAVSANSIIKSYNPTQDAEVFARGMQEAYRYGRYNYSEHEMYQEGNFLLDLTEEQIHKAYKLGQIQSGSDTAIAVAKLKEAIANSKGKKGEGKVHFEGDAVNIDVESLKDQQKVSLKTMEMLSKALGIEFYVYSSYINKNGERVYKTADGEVKSAPNGIYDKATGAIHIDLNAGEKGEGTMLFTVAHELTHFIKAWSPAKFKVLANFLVEQYGKKGVSVEELVRRQMEHMRASGRKNVTYDLAFEEFVADSMETMLTSGNVMETLAELKRRDEGLWNKIKEFFSNLVDLLKKTVKAYEGYGPDTIEGQTVAEMTDVIEQFEKLFAEGLVDASENFRAISGTEEQTLAEVGIGFDEETRSVHSLRYSTGRKDALGNVIDLVTVGKKNFNTEAIAQLVAKGTGRSIEDARKWVNSEITIANIVMNNPEFLDFEADDRYESIKKNSDYPQGTVDLSNLCPKRTEFTAMFDMLQRKYPDKLFTANDVAAMRNILKEKGITVACGACFVEDRRQLLGEIADTYIGMWKEAVETGKPLQKTNASGNKVTLTVTTALAKQYGLKKGSEILATDKYIPTQYDLTTYEGFKLLEKNHPTIAMGFNRYNNSRGQQAGRLIEGRAEYNRQILGWSPTKVKSVNNNGGLRIFSFSDFEVVHLLDLVQVILDCSAMGVKIQGYTKIPSFARLVRDTGIKINRSLIPKGQTGMKMVDGKQVLDYDTTEGIDINNENFLNERDNPNVGNILIGINPTQIGLAMLDEFVDYIIPFHTNKSKDICKALGLAEWVNYKESQHEKDIDTGKASKHNVNIYTQVINKYNPTNKVEFVDAFLKVCREQKKIPRYSEFLNKEYKADGAYTDEYGSYDFTYREGYHKLLVDFKMFDHNGNILPQGEITPNLDDAFMAELLKAEVDKKQNYEFPQEVYDRLDKEFGEEDALYFERKKKVDETVDKAIKQKGDLGVKFNQERISEFPADITAMVSAASDGQINLEGKYIAIHGSDIWHEYERRTNAEDEVGRRQIPFTTETLKEAVMAIYSPDVIENLFTKSQLPSERESFAYAKKSPNGYYVVVEAVGGKRNPNVVPVMLLQFNEAKWNDMMASGKTLGEILYENDPEKRNALDVAFNKKNRVTVAQFASKKAIANTPRSPQLGNSVPQSSNFVKDSDENPHSDRKIVDIPNNKYVEMYHHFGSTKNYDVAGYMLGNGIMLDFSGKHWGDDYSTSRQVDHRDVQEVLDDRGNNGVNAMIDMIGNGNIRLMPEVGGINLAVKPNATQMSVLRGYINHFKGEVVIDIDKVGGDTIHSFSYTRGTSSSKVLSDLKAYFDEGIVPEQKASDETDIHQFLYSDRNKDSEGNLLTDAQKEFFKDSKVRDKKGNLLVCYHGTDSDSDITAFYSYYSQDGTSLFFTDNKYVASTYTSKNKIMSVYVNLSNPLIADAKGKNSQQIPTPDVFFSMGFGKIMEARQIAYYAKALGFDGVIIKNVVDVAGFAEPRKGTDIIAFNPEQIKDITNKNPTTDDDIRYSLRNKDSVSNRALLANALESAVTNEFEKKTLNDYKEELGRADALEKELGEIRSKIRDLSFAKGPKDTEALKKLREQEVKTVNRIDIRDKKLLRLEATKPLKDIIHREREKAYKRAEKEGKEALAKYREKTAETQRELLNRWQESRHKAVEGRNKTAMRHKIRGIVSELNNLLLHGTKDKHIMIGLQKAVASALDAVNMDTVGAEERVAKYNALIAKEKNPDIIESLTATRDRILAQGDKIGERLANLKNAYSEIKNSDDPLIANSYDEVIFSKIEAVVTSVGDTALRDMSLSQLEDVYDLYKMVLTTIRNSNKAFKAKKGEEISVLGNRVMEEVETVGGKKQQRLKALEGIKQYGWNILKPVYAFKLIGSKTFSEVFDNVRAGEDTWARDIDEAQAFRTATFKKYNYKSWDFNKKYKFTSKAGVSFDLTLEQMLSLYAYSKRKQADDHLEKGGFVFDTAIEVTEKNKLGIPLKYNVNTATAHNLSKETLAQIIGNLSTEQKGFVDEMQDYLSTVMGEKGNEVSLEMYGVKLFKEKFYFPLKSARQFMFEQNEVAGEVKIKNSGFSKETVAHANNPIILDNFMDVWANHVNDMSMYHSFVLALEDFNRVFNYKTPTADNMPTESVKMYLQNAYGTEAASYIKQLLTDLNGGARSDPQAGIINKAIGKFKKAKVFASMSVVVQQPSALGRAFAYVDPKYFVGKKVNKNEQMKTWNEVKKYAPIAIIKEMGYFDVGNGRSTVNYLKGDKSIMDRVDDVASWLPAKADELTWCTIWEAVKRETADKNKALKAGSEEFLKVAGERFTEVIVNTQVYDSVLSRSGMMRSKDTGVKMATAFMAEPTTAMNMMVDAHLKTKRGDKKSARRIRGGVITSVLINSILVAFVYAARDDDEDETYAEKYLGSLTSEVIDGLNPLTYLPIVKDIWSIAQGFDVERSDMSMFADLIESGKKLFSKNESTLDKVMNFTGDVSSIFGLPVKNIMRDVKALFNVANGIIEGKQTTSAGIGYSVMDAIRNTTPVWGWIDKGPAKSEKLYNALASGDQTQIDRLKGGYKDEEAYESAVKKAIRDNDKDVKKMVKAFANGDFSSVKSVLETVASRYGISESLADEIIDAEYNYYKGKITDAAKALKDGKTSEYKDIVKTLRERYRGVYSQDDIVNAVKEKSLEPTEESSKIEEAESVYETWQINSALENGDTDTATAIVDDLVRVKTENYLAKAKAEAEKNGKKFNENTALKEAESKARSSVKSSITSHWKPLYKEAYKNKDSEEMLRIRQLLLATGVYGRTSELLDTVTGWLKD